MVRSVTKIVLLAALALGTAARAAHAEPAGRLSYARGPGAEFCPDEGSLRRAVAARLGEDPFDPSLARTFRLTIGANGARLRGSVELLAGGVSEGRRELEADPAACSELVEAMALAVSLSINPNLVLDAPSPGTEVAPPPVPPTAPRRSPSVMLASPRPSTTRDAPARPKRARAPRAPVALATGAFAHGAIGTGPGAAAGGSAVLRVGGSWWNAGVEARLDALSRAGIGRNGTVHSTLVGAVLAPCARFGPASGCPLLLLGSLFARSRGVATERADRGFFAATGGRLAATAPLGEHLSLEARVDALYPLTPVTIDLDGAPIWRASASGALGVGVVWEFP
jgi:hypothetical protein